MRDAQIGNKKDQLKLMISEIDFAQNKKINYTEFLAATIDADEYMTDTRLQGVFNTFDVDNSGSITTDNMVMTFSKIGQEISK